MNKIIISLILFWFILANGQDFLQLENQFDLLNKKIQNQQIKIDSIQNSIEQILNEIEIIKSKKKPNERLQKENRILSYDWSLYDTMHCVYRPEQLSPKEMERLYSEALWKIYTNGGPIKIFKRAMRNFRANFLSAKEIYGLLKLGIRMYKKQKK